MMMKTYRIPILFLLIFLWSCNQVETMPKPFGNLRLSYENPVYTKFNTDCPFDFEVADFSIKQNKKEQCSFNIYYPKLKATVYLTYEPIHHNLTELISDAEKSVYEPHTSRASYIKPSLIVREEDKVYGTLYELGGNAALNYQFHITDSTQNFLRGALYFNAYPNPDSLAPAKNYMLSNIKHLMETLKWK